MNTVLITGTSRGVGKSLKRAFESRGDRVVGYRRDELGDIRDFETIKKLKLLAEETKVNILINNAGVYSADNISVTEVNDARQIIETNLIAPILLTISLWPIIVSNSGTIIFINSVAGRMREAGEISYRSSKFGLTGFSSSLYFDGLRDGVRIIDIPFGGINTDMLSHRPGMDKNKLQQPEEAAKVIIDILESKDSSKIKHLLIQGCIIDTKNSNNIGIL